MRMMLGPCPPQTPADAHDARPLPPQTPAGAGPVSRCGAQGLREPGGAGCPITHESTRLIPSDTSTSAPGNSLLHGLNKQWDSECMGRLWVSSEF